MPLGITSQHTEEALCRSFVTALAGQAGCNYNLEPGFDYGVDCTIRGVKVRPNGRRIVTGYAVDLQLKTTTRWRRASDWVLYRLEAKTWNDLVDRGRDINAMPLHLVLLCLPRHRDYWVRFSECAMVMQHCCYHYQPPAGSSACEGVSTTIRIPRRNLLTVDALHVMLTSASFGP